jgi:hypothetical protein
MVVMNDQLAATLIDVVENGREAEEIRARAAISRGPVLEQVDTELLDDPEDLPIAEATFRRLQDSLRRVCSSQMMRTSSMRRRKRSRWREDCLETTRGKMMRTNEGLIVPCGAGLQTSRSSRFARRCGSPTPGSGRPRPTG